MSEYGLKQLVDELVSLNDENLARRVIETSDVQRCLSELQDMLANDVVVMPWIKVSDRMPLEPEGENAEVRCIVSFKTSTMPLTYERRKVRGKVVTRWLWNDWGPIFHGDDMIVAWMPLPDPIKGR